MKFAKFFMMAVVAAAGLSIVGASVSKAECIRVITTWKLVNGVATVANGRDALRTGSGFSALGAAAGVASLTIEQRETHLIEDARSRNHSPLMAEFEAMVNRDLGRTVNPEVLYQAIDDASNRNQICSHFGGAYTFTEAARVVAQKIATLANQ